MAKTIEFDAIPPIRTRKEMIETYIGQFDERDHQRASHIADSIHLKDRPLASYLVIIPVAAHQETEQIPRALEQYARQTTNQAFSIILGLNSPAGEQNNPAISATICSIEQAKRHHPNLDIRTAVSFYDSPTIGTIRRDLWNGALLASMADSAYENDTNEVIGMNHDIDLISMSSRYIERVQQHYKHRQNAYAQAGIPSVPLAIRSTTLSHAPSPNHPIISKGVYWMDFVSRQAGTPYEASLVIPMSNYADKGGFQAGVITHETHSITQHERSSRRIIPGTIMQTSPRRYIDRLRYGYHNVWTEETFGPNNACRTDNLAPDLNQGELENIIDQSDLRGTIAAMTTSDINTLCLNYTPRLLESHEQEIETYLFMQEMKKIIDKKIILSKYVLERVIGSPSLTKQASSLYFDDDFYDSIADKHFLSDD